jgi:hypothetical protein
MFTIVAPVASGAAAKRSRSTWRNPTVSGGVISKSVRGVAVPPRERGRVGEGASALPIRGDVIASDQRAVDDLQLIAVALRRKLW